MSVITIPIGVLVKRQDLGIRDFALEFSNGDSGATQIAINGPPRLTCTLVSNDDVDRDEAALWRSMVFALKGRVNLLAVHDIQSPQPRGTMRGVLTVASAAAAGADTLRVTGGVSQAGKTLLRGDWVGVNQSGTNRQLLHVQADAVADSSGTILLSIANNLRVSVAGGTSVAWDKPTCLMRRDAQETSWSSSGAVQGSFNLQLTEHWI